MKKLLILLTAVTAFAFASCASAPAEKECCGSEKCSSKSEDKPSCCGKCGGAKE